MVQELEVDSSEEEDPEQFRPQIQQYGRHNPRLSGVRGRGNEVYDQRNYLDNEYEEGKVTKLMKKKGTITNMEMMDSAGAGDIVSIAGLNSPSIGHTVANMEVMTVLPNVDLDPPTISMTFSVNDSPLVGRDGTHMTGGKIGDRLSAEAETNLAINVIPGTSESYEVQGRGELQLGILIENMRCERFELSVSPPKVMYKYEKGEKLEPIEEVTIEVNEEHVGVVMEALSQRKVEVTDMGPVPGSVDKTKMTLTCPSRGLVTLHDQKGKGHTSMSIAEWLKSWRGKEVSGSFSRNRAHWRKRFPPDPGEAYLVKQRSS
ncbi:hypothetical protein ZOSMA_389G00140 [Zostera marina]|uniref:Elongation factor EFG domain-containing protein n=1 Tax=Zostera marina TaxID=29655 RepID=A0A0K9P779_ZOSMR|nr:hypothetical protein ZOSMA_389G00140 [Zostera marina]